MPWSKGLSCSTLGLYLHRVVSPYFTHYRSGKISMTWARSTQPNFWWRSIWEGTPPTSGPTWNSTTFWCSTRTWQAWYWQAQSSFQSFLRSSTPGTTSMSFPGPRTPIVVRLCFTYASLWLWRSVGLWSFYRSGLHGVRSSTTPSKSSSTEVLIIP